MALCIFLPSPLFAGSFLDELIDPSDGQLDMTSWLNSQYGVMPLPIIVTEPAVGYGGGAALIYLHDRLGSKSGIAPEKRPARKSPPSISAVFGAKTENGTWFAGGFHFGSWRDDRFRYTGVIADASIKLDYYGLGFAVKDPARLTTDAVYTAHELKSRLGDSDFFIGGKYTYADADNSFNLNDTLPGNVSAYESSDRNASLALLLSYDSRDNVFTPTRGLQVDGQVSQYHEKLGGDSNFETYAISARYYFSFGEKVTLGLRGEAERIEGDAPFYLYPYIKLRGIKAMQYQGEKVFLGETELRWNFYERWSVLGFVGAGEVHGT